MNTVIRDILLEICKHLFPWDAQNVGRTCRRFYSIVTEAAYLARAQYTQERNNINYTEYHRLYQTQYLYCGFKHGYLRIYEITNGNLALIYEEYYRYNQLHGMVYNATATPMECRQVYKNLKHGTMTTFGPGYRYETYIWGRSINSIWFTPTINLQPNEPTQNVTYWNPEVSVYVNRFRNNSSDCLIETIALSDGYQKITYMKGSMTLVLTFQRTKHIRTEQFDGRGDLRVYIDHSARPRIPYRTWHPRTKRATGPRPSIASRSINLDNRSARPNVGNAALPLRWMGQFCLRNNDHHRCGIWRQYNREGLLITEINYGPNGCQYTRTHQRDSW